MFILNMQKGKKAAFDLDSMLEQMINDDASRINFSSTDGELLFCAQIDDAYHLRNEFDFLRGPNLDANIIFTPDGIDYRCSNGIKSILNTFTIRGHDICYHFDSKYDTVVVGVNLAIVARTTHGIGKKDTLKIFMRKGVNAMFYEIISMTNPNMSSVQSSGHIPVKDLELIEHILPPIIAIPLQSIPVSTFCHKCAILSNMKCNKVRIVVYERGVKFEGIDNYDQVQSVQRFYPPKLVMIENTKENSITVDVMNNSIDNNGSEIYTIYVSMLTIKWLSKLTNISAHGDKIRMYCNTSGPLQIRGNIGFYGQYDIYLRNELNYNK